MTECRHPKLLEEISECERKGESSTRLIEGAKKKHQNQASIDRFATKVIKTPERAEKLATMVQWIIHDGLPFSTVDSPYFRRFMQAYGATPISRTQLMDTLPALEAVLQRKVKTALRDAQAVAVTSDSWTDARRRKYVSVTLHWIDLQWKLRHSCVSVLPLNESHTGVLLSREIRREVDRWLQTRQLISAHVTDNGGNFTNASIQLVGEDNHIPCFAHTLQLVIHDVIGKDSDAHTANTTIQKFRNLVDVILKHSHLRNELSRLQSVGTY